MSLTLGILLLHVGLGCSLGAPTPGEVCGAAVNAEPQEAKVVPMMLKEATKKIAEGAMNLQASNKKEVEEQVASQLHEEANM